MDSVIVWFKISLIKFRHRNDSVEQRAEYLDNLKAQLKQSIQAVKEDLKDEPATRELHELFDSLDEVSNDICQ